MIQASVDALPYEDATFDRILTAHTAYFWTDPVAALREVRRVTRPEGRLVLAFHEHDPVHAANRFPAPMYTLRTEAELTACAQAAGWQSIHAERIERKSHTAVWLVLSA